MKHPSDRAERLRIKKIKDEQSGRVRQRTPEERLDDEFGQFKVRQETEEESVA